MQVDIHKKGFAAAALLVASMACGQAEAGAVYGYVSKAVPANSDVLVSIPVNNSAEVELTTSSVAGSIITVPNSPDFAAGEFNQGTTFAKYYVRFIDGPAAGLWSSITANSETTITIDNIAVAALATPGGGDTIRVYKHHTIGSIFPDSLEGISFVPGQTQILTFSSADTQNKAPGSGATIGYSARSGWGSQAARPLNPEEAFVIRNSSGDSLTFVAPGVAPDHPVSYLLTAGVAKDTPVGTGFPVDVTVEDTSTGAAGRQILTYAASGQNLAPGSGQTFTFGGRNGWGANADAALVPNTAFFLRQGSSDAGGVITVVSPY